MKQIIATILIVTITALLPNVSMSCSALPPIKSIGERAKVILVGKAISSKWQSERRELEIEVEITESIVGDLGQGKVLAISPCGLPIESGERVIVAVFDKTPGVYPAEMYESAFREGAKSVR